MVPPHAIPPEPAKKKKSPWAYVYKTLKDFYQLRDGFDGDAAQAPNFDTIELAIAWSDVMEHFFCGLTPPTAVRPGLNANIYLIWEGNGAAYREFEIDKEGLVRWTCVTRDGEKWHSGQL